MKKLLTFLVVLLLVVSLISADLWVRDTKGELCNPPIAQVYRVVSSAMFDFIDQLGFNEASYSDYTLTVVDGMGSPISDVIVKIKNSDGKTKTSVTDKDGIAVFRNMVVTEYEVIIEQGFSNAIIDQASYTISKDTTSFEIVLRDGEKSVDISGDVKDGSYAYYIGEGSYNVNSDESGTAYYVFNAHVTGIYKVSITTANSATTVGYYGIPMFVQSTHRGEGEYDGRSFELIIQDIATPYVLGVKSCADAEVILSIERIDNAPFDPEYAPWTQITKEADIDKCVIPAGVTLKDFDITDPSLSVELRDDGFYYTSDGKLVYIRVTGSNDKFLPKASLAYLAGFVDNQIGINIGGYIYDDDGNFVEKRNYNLMIKDYMDYCDSKYGVVPLTAELAECMQLHGTSAGWWNPSAGNYLFNGVDIVPENAWLFLCMIEQ